MTSMRRREFITLLGGAAAAWPVAAQAQQAAMPVVGYLDTGRPETAPTRPAGFRKGLSEMGYVEGRNVVIDSRFASNDYGRLPELAAELVRRPVAVLVAAGGMAAALAAKAATATIPIVYRSGVDPVQAGLVASFNRPGGNVTGINEMSHDIMSKQLGLLHEIKRGTAPLAVLIDPNAPGFDTIADNARTAASALGREVELVRATNNREIDLAFADLARRRVDALALAPDFLFSSRRTQIITLATHHRMPTIYQARDYVDVGGLMSYGVNASDQYRQAGIYTGRILKGEKPADLPILRPTKFEFVINLQTAKVLGLTIPATLLALADEVIE